MTAASPGPVPPVTPGHAAYVAYAESFTNVDMPGWRYLDDSDHDRWEAAAQAAIATSGGLIASMRAELADRSKATETYLSAIATLSAALREIKDCTGTSTKAHHIARKALDDADHIRPQPAPGPLRTALEAIASGAQGSLDTGLPLDREWVVSRALSALGWAQMPEPDEYRGPQPAPELAAARDASDLEVAAIIAERNQLRIALRRLADDGNLEARDRLAATRPELTASGTAPELAAAMAERDEARAELAKAERERDSLARRCAVRFDEAQKLRALVAETRAGAVLYGADEDPCERAAAARDDREALVRDAREDPF